MFDKLKNGLKVFVDKISKSELSENDLEPIIWELQLQLVSNDVAIEVADKISEEIKNNLKGYAYPRFGDKTSLVKDSLREAVLKVMTTNLEFNLFEIIDKKNREGSPLVLLFIGINGTGKTTTIAKISKLLLNQGRKVVLASGDTFRAGAIEQLEEHARRLDIRVIKHKYGSDPAAVSFDAVSHAKAQEIDAVLIDTAGRMQTNRNLMDELRKIKRVVQPDLTIMVLDALTGNDAIEQAKTFQERVGFDAIVLTKVDADAKGGSSLSVSYLTGRPIIYIGTGQDYGDLQPFEAEWFANKILEDK